MNSITAHLGPETIIATLRVMRSGTRDYIMVVEGMNDIKLFSNLLALPNSRFISCAGKENLMKTFEMGPSDILDSGVIFVRDRDFDEVESIVTDSQSFLVSDHYDVEMSFCDSPLMKRIFTEFLGGKYEEKRISTIIEQISTESAKIGALRLISYQNDLGLKFEDLNFSFLNSNIMAIDTKKMIVSISSKSGIRLNATDILNKIEKACMELNHKTYLSSGKDFISLLHIFLYKKCKCCKSHECNPEVLGRLLRTSAAVQDLSGTKFLDALSKIIAGAAYSWGGRHIPSSVTPH